MNPVLARGGMIAAVTLVAYLLTACQQGQSQTAAAPAAAPPAEVTVVTLQSQSVALEAELPGRAIATRKAEVRPQISGIVQRRLFEEGAQVEAGDRLYQIDPSRYQAALQTAKANLASAQASLAMSQSQYERYQNLLKEKAVSQQQFDNAQAAFQQAEANVALSQAAVRTAEIDLAYTEVTAPISGRIGKSNVTEGALVSAQQAEVLTTIHQLNPIYVDMAQPARNLLDLRRQAMAGTIDQGQAAHVALMLEDGSEYEYTGELKFSEMSVNETTGTVVVRAVFPNPDHLLMPGMFVRAQVQQAVQPDALLVPQRGVSRDRQGNATALVVTEANTVEARNLVANRAVGDSWLVQSGLQPGDRVIVEGLQKVAPGAAVKPVEQSEAGDSQSVTQAGG